MRNALLPEHHPNGDLFIADIFDNIPVKDDIASMSHPIFSLSTKPALRELHYKQDNIDISIAPSTLGLPTIFDKDILLYCASLIMQQINQGKEPQRTLRISTHDLLVSINRKSDGRSYERIREALKRLRGVSITTNMRTNNRIISHGFGLIDSWEAVESSRVKQRMVRLEITLSEWFYNSLLAKEVLTINRAYFRLRKPIERRIYEIARKHCGKQNKWSISLSALQIKTGSAAPERKFRFFVRQISTTNHLPDYNIAFDSQEDMIVFTPKDTEQAQQSLSFDDLPRISPQAIETGRSIVQESSTGWDFYVLQAEFTESLTSGKFSPDNVNGAFINFVKKKVQETP